MEDSFKRDCTAICCSFNHAAAVGIHGHLYVWGSNMGAYQGEVSENSSESEVENSAENFEMFCGKLGFVDTTLKEIKNPAFYSLRHPIYEIKASQVACGMNFTAIVATEKNADIYMDETDFDDYFSREIEEFLPDIPPKSYNIPDDIYSQICNTNKIRKEIEDYLKLHSISFIELFKSKIIKLTSFLNIMENIINSKVPRNKLQEFIEYKKMKLPGNGITLKPLYELVVKCYQGRGVLYLMGKKDEILPKHGDKLQYYPIKHDTLMYYLINLPDAVSVSKVSCGLNFVLILSHSGNVYSWGSECSQALGKNRTVTYLTIKPISELCHETMKIVDIVCGYNHCLALNNCGVVYTWGEGSYGKLGNGRRENVCKPEPISVDTSDVVYINAGCNSSFCIGRENCCFAWGDISNNKFGMISYTTTDKPMNFTYKFDVLDIAIGSSKCAFVATTGNVYLSDENEDSQINLNRKYKNLEGVQFHQASCYNETFFAISTRGSIFSWATAGPDPEPVLSINPILPSNQSAGSDLPHESTSILGRLGEKNVPLEIISCSQHFCNKDVEEMQLTENIVIEPSRQITRVSCGEENTYLLTDKGEIIAAGSNYLGQLALVNGDLDDLVEDQEEVHVFTCIPRLSRAFKIRLNFVTCGAFHALAINDEGKVLTWGANDYGQLGKGSFSKCEKYPEVVQGLKAALVVQVAAGLNHSMALDKDGNVFVFGCAEHGKLGLGKINSSINHASPVRIKSLSNVKKISCGPNHSAAIDKENVILSWGFGWNGQLGCGNKDTLYEPTSILIHVEWKSVACGTKHTLGLTVDGLVYHWGEVCMPKEDLEVFNPIKVKGLEDIKFKKILASEEYSAAIVELGTTVYFWGRQVYKRLASDRDFQETLVKPQGLAVPHNEKIADISIGRYHGALVTDQGKVYTWGYSYNGRVGDTNYSDGDWQKPFDYKPANLSKHLQLDNSKGETLKQDLQKLLQEESEQSKEANLREVDQQILLKFKECIDTFIDITDKDKDQDLFFMKCEHKQLSRIQQKPFDCRLVTNNPWGEEVAMRISAWGALVTTYQVHCCFLYKLLSLNLKDERKFEMLNMIYADMEGDKRMIYTALYLSRMLLRKALKTTELKFPEFVDGSDCRLYRELVLKILLSSFDDLIIFSKLAADTLHQLGTIVHNDEFGIDQDPTHVTSKLSSMIKITAYQSNRNIVDRRMSKLKSVMTSFVDIVKKFIRENGSFSNVIYFIAKDFLSISSTVFDINYTNFENLNDNAVFTINCVLKIVFEPLWLALENPDRFCIIKDVQFPNTENNFKSLALTVQKFFDGTELGLPGERWLTDINNFLKHEENMEIKRDLLERILKIGGDLEQEYLQSLFLHSLEPFNKEVTVSASSLLFLHRITAKNLEKLRVNNPSYDPLMLIIKELSPVPTNKLFGRGENVNLLLFTRSLRQDQSISRCPICEMLVSRDMAPSNFKQVIDIFDPMPPNSSEAILTNILATGPRKQTKGKLYDYIQKYQENYSTFLKDFSIFEKVSNLITNIDTLTSAALGVAIESSELIDKSTLEGDREKMLVMIEENCAIEYKRRIQHSKLQMKISQSLDALYSVMQAKLNECLLDEEMQQTLLFNLDYGASNLELEQFSDSVMFSIYLNKIREYTNKKDMSLNLFENLTHEMKDALRGFMKRSLNELLKKKVILDYTLDHVYNPKNIVFSFEIDSGFLVIIATNSPRKINICGRDEFREEEVLLYEKISDDRITNMREECKDAEDNKVLK